MQGARAADSRPVARSRLRRALDASRALALAGDADAVLETLAYAVHDLLGMSVVVNRRRMALDVFEVTLEVGGQTSETLMGETYADEMMLLLLDERYERDGLILIPQNAPVWAAFEGAVLIEQRVVLEGP